MVKQYPDILFITGSTAEMDENNDWGSTAGAAVELPCRYEVAGDESYKEDSPGPKITFVGICYMPIPAAPVPLGSAVEVKRDGVKIAAGKVLKYHPGQLNARVWL